MNFKSDLGKIKKGNKKSKSKDQISAIQNVQHFFDLRQKIIDFFRDYSHLISEAEYKAKYARGLKILTSKQMLQVLPIALAQVKAVNTSVNLLNEIRHIYSLHQAKEIIKKYILNSQVIKQNGYYIYEF